MTDLLDRLSDAAVLQGPSAAGTPDQGSRAPGTSDQHPLDLQLRLAADKELVDTLRIHNFRGPLYDQFVHTLAAYGMPVMQSLIRRGTIFVMTADLGRPVSRREIPAESVHDLAVDTVVIGITGFQKALVEGAWKPEGGASLKTYFIGSCVRAFANVYRRHQRDLDDYRRVTPSDPADLQEITDLKYATKSPEETVIDRSLSDWVLHHLDATTAKVLVMKFVKDLTHAEIAQTLDISARAVEGRIRRARAILQDHSGGRVGRSQTVR